MKNETKEQTLPKWFKGLLYTNGETVTNKFSGAEAYLTGVELSMYDFIMGTQFIMEMAPHTVTQRRSTTFKKGCVGSKKITLTPIWHY